MKKELYLKIKQEILALLTELTVFKKDVVAQQGISPMQIITDFFRRHDAIQQQINSPQIALKPEAKEDESAAERVSDSDLETINSEQESIYLQLQQIKIETQKALIKARSICRDYDNMYQALPQDFTCQEQMEATTSQYIKKITVLKRQRIAVDTLTADVLPKRLISEISALTPLMRQPLAPLSDSYANQLAGAASSNSEDTLINPTPVASIDCEYHKYNQLIEIAKSIDQLELTILRKQIIPEELPELAQHETTLTFLKLKDTLYPLLITGLLDRLRMHSKYQKDYQTRLDYLREKISPRCVFDKLGYQEHLILQYLPTDPSNQSNFDKVKSPQTKAWTEIDRMGIKYSTLFSPLARDESNPLKIMLATSDEDFIDAIKYGRLAVSDPAKGGDELSVLLLSRLHYICDKLISDPSLTNAQKRPCREAFQLIGQYPLRDVLIYDKDALLITVTQLILHEAINPTQKSIWLGTARAVNAYRQQADVGGTYLNCDDKKWTWGLNRAWMMIAMSLGYEAKLAEQHFPDMEEAMISRNPANVLLQLLNATRGAPPAGKGHKWGHSMYNGGDGPTATPLEILALLDIGCVVRKDQEGHIRLQMPLGSVREEALESPKVGSIKHRSCSLDSFFKASPLPPLRTIAEHFETPQDSVDIRLL